MALVTSHPWKFCLPHKAKGLRGRRVKRLATRLTRLFSGAGLSSATVFCTCTQHEMTGTVLTAVSPFAFLVEMQFLQRLLTRWCSQMLLPPQSLQRLRIRWCSQILLPPQSWHWLFCRWCLQMLLPTQSLHWLLLRWCTQMLLPPHVLHLHLCRWCSQRLRAGPPGRLMLLPLGFIFLRRGPAWSLEIPFFSAPPPMTASTHVRLPAASFSQCPSPSSPTPPPVPQYPPFVFWLCCSASAHFCSSFSLFDSCSCTIWIRVLDMFV